MGGTQFEQVYLFFKQQQNMEPRWRGEIKKEA